MPITKGAWMARMRRGGCRWISVPIRKSAADWVKDLFEARLLGASSQALRELCEADRAAMEGVAV
jgi:hypothetical protein